MKNNIKQYEDLRDRVDSAKISLTKLETLVDTKKKELKKVADELKAMNVDVANIKEYKATLEKKLEESYQKVEQLIEKVEQKLGDAQNVLG